MGIISAWANAGPPARARSSLPEPHPREAHHAMVVDIPLLVLQELSARLRSRLQKRIERRRPAPLQIVLPLPHELPETAGVERLDALDPLLVARAHFLHFALARHRREAVVIARPHVRHVHA